jgi:ketosteroid isomerase-like protein
MTGAERRSAIMRTQERFKGGGWLIPVLSGLMLPIALTAQAVTTSEVADRYVDAYEAMDLDVLTAFYTDETILEDPTASAFGQEVRLTGAAAIRPFLEQAFTGVTSLRLDVSRRFASGPYAIINGVGYYSVPGTTVGVQDETYEVWADFTFILEVREGKIVRHTDYVDYDGMAARAPR